MEQIGSDHVLVVGARVIVHSHVDMAGWEVRAFRRTLVLFRGGRYFVAVKDRLDDGFRYTLERWPEDRDELDGGLVEYGERFVAERDAERAARAAARTVRAVLVPLYPLVGLLPSAVKRRLADSYGISGELATGASLWLELMLASALGAMFTIQSVAGVYGGALGARDGIPWLDRFAGGAVGALLLIVPDLVVRYSKHLGDSKRLYGFWEWLFRREGPSDP